MALFHRRIIQRELDFLRPKILRAERENDVLRKLNSHNRQALAMEWEIAIVASLARLADVTHEKVLGSARPDLFVRYHYGKGRFEFVADIVTISDIESDKQNPTDFFFEEFGRISGKVGLCGGFDIRIGDRRIGKYPDAKTKLLLPAKGKIPSFIEGELAPFFRQIMEQPSIPSRFEYDKSDIRVRVTYDPKKRGGTTGGHALCASPSSWTRNPLSSALDDKAAQLRKCGYDGLVGIIVTDGHCHTLHSANPGLGVFSRDNLVDKFLSTHPAISFVTTSHHETHGGYSRTEHKLFHKIYWQRGLPVEVSSSFYALVNDAFKTLPSVASAPQNAWLDIRGKKEISRGCKLGVCSWTPRQKLTVSSRTLVGLLAGTLTKREFKLLFYQTLPPQGGPLIHFFRHVVELHVSVARASIERTLDEDDDWITFEIGTSPVYDSVQKSSVMEGSCDLSVKVVARYLAGLDYSLASGKAHNSHFGQIPDEIRAFLTRMESEGRMLVDVQVVDDAKQIRLLFGGRDAATSEYF